MAPLKGAMLSLLTDLSNYDHVIWDMNGTLVDDAHVCVGAVNPILRDYNLPEITTESYRDFFRFPVMDYYHELGFRLSQEEFETLSHRFHDHYHSLLPTAGLFAGTEELLKTLREQKKRLSILTAARTDDLEKTLSHFSILHLFDHLFGLSHRSADSKVSRGRDLMEIVQIPPEKSVLVGDTLHDLEVGEALGLDVILVTGGHMSEQRLRSKTSRVHQRSF